MGFLNGKDSVLSDSIDRILSEMNQVDTDSNKYQESLTRLERLMSLQKEEKSNGVSPDTMALVLGNLAGILIIVGYERLHVITSRGLQFILRSRLQ